MLGGVAAARKRNAHWKFWPRRRLVPLCAPHFFPGQKHISTLRTCARTQPVQHSSFQTPNPIYTWEIHTYIYKLAQHEAPHRTRNKNSLRETRFLLRKRHHKPHRRPSWRLRPQRLPRPGTFPSSSKIAPPIIPKLLTFSTRAPASTTSVNPSPTSPQASRATTCSPWDSASENSQKPGNYVSTSQR